MRTALALLLSLGQTLCAATMYINWDGNTNTFASPHKVYLMGDSITGTSGKYGTMLQTLLGADWQVVWKGVSGDHTLDMRTRFITDVISPGDAEYVVVQGGVNDISGNHAESETEGTLQAMYDWARTARIKVVSVNITPFYGTAWADAPRLVKQANENAWQLNTSSNVSYRVDAYSALVDPATPYTLLPAYDSGDHLHLSTAGYAALATNIYNAVTWTPKIGSTNSITADLTDIWSH